LSISKRLRRAAVAVAAVAVLGTVASTALAGGPLGQWGSSNDPNTTNVPYLAWRGENLRLVKCFGVNDFEQAYENTYKRSAGFSSNSIEGLFASVAQTNVQLEDWSGADTGVNTPKEVINGARTFLYYNVRTLDPVICFQDTWASQKAGLGQFKLTVSLNLGDIVGTRVPVGGQFLVMQHQWLAGWMSLNAPTLDEVTSRDPATNPEGLGDPKGDGTFFAGNGWVQNSSGAWVYDGADHPGEIRATVKGTLPLGQNYSELGLGASVTLPDDWAALAGALATDGSQFNSNQAMRWDIHDELVNEQGVTSTNPASAAGGRNGVGTTNKNVDNTEGGGQTNGDGAYYRNGVITSTDPNPLLLPLSDYPTAGPFDPNFAEETLLPDGLLNSGDAPMPAARIDFAIAPNTDPLHSSDGVGSFVSASKAKDYSLDDTGTNAKEHNLFAPFYSQYIPATARDPFGYASGVDGALITNNFPGFLAFGRIANWQSFPLAGPTATNTLCRQRGDVYRTTPGGTQTTAVYTDEHGEARVGFLPGGRTGSDFYFDALVPYPDSNNGCDLAGVKVLGTSHITAIARYPYQKVTDPDKPAKSGLVKTVYNLFDKHLSYYSKNYAAGSANNRLIKIVVAHAQDINGQPFQNEVVCFTGEDALGGAISGFFPPVGDFTVLRADGTSFIVHNIGEVPHPAGIPNGFLCTRTDDNGNAVIEVTGSIATMLDVVAYFTEEGLSRDIDVPLATPSVMQDNPPLTPAAILAGGSATTGPGSNGTQSPSPAKVDQIVKAAVAGGFGIIATPAAGAAITPVQTIVPVKTITPAKTIVKTRLLSMRLVRPAHAKAYIMVKVQSAHKTAKIVIALKGKHGKTIAKISKTIAANKQVKITSSSIKLAVKKVSLTSVK
jgi:hypothetical protein